MGEWLPAVGVVAGMAGLLGIAYAVFTSARVQKTVDLYKLENEAQGKRIATLEADIARSTERLAAVEKENAVLRDLATGRTIMEALARDIREAESLRKEEHREMMARLDEMKEALAEIWQGVVSYFGRGGGRA